MSDFISRPIAFRIEEVICDRPNGIIIMLAILKYLPAFALENINSQIGSPSARNVDNKMLENRRLVFIEKFIFDVILQ